MLSDEQLREAYGSGFNAPDLPDEFRAWKTAGLRAVEAAVRADQIERDAGIAESRHDVGWDEGHELMTARFPDDGRRVAAAIRAQLDGEN